MPSPAPGVGSRCVYAARDDGLALDARHALVARQAHRRAREEAAHCAHRRRKKGRPNLPAAPAAGGARRCIRTSSAGGAKGLGAAVGARRSDISLEATLSASFLLGMLRAWGGEHEKAAAACSPCATAAPPPISHRSPTSGCVASRASAALDFCGLHLPAQLLGTLPARPPF